MLDGRVSGASQVEYTPFGKPPLKRELQQLFNSVEAKQYKRPDMNKTRLGFALNDFAETKWKNLTGTARWSDGAEMLGAAGAEEPIRNMLTPAGKPSRPSTRISAPVSAGQVRDSSISKEVFDGLRVNQLQVDMKAFGSLYAGGHRCADQESAAEPLRTGFASTTAAGIKRCSKP